MEAGIVDLRYKMKNILKAVERGEEVAILYHGRKKAIIKPAAATRRKSRLSSENHLVFGMRKDSSMSVEEVMNDMRKSRYHDI